MLPYVLAFVLLLTVFTAYSMLSHVFMSAPFVLSHTSVVTAMVQAANLQPHQTVIDLGCGDGRLLIAAKKHQPTITAIGYELVPAACIQAKLRAWFNQVSITVHCRSLYKADLHVAAVVFVFLYPGPMQKLVQKFNAELPSGALVISSSFAIKNRTPENIITVKDGLKERKLFTYRW